MTRGRNSLKKPVQKRPANLFCCPAECELAVSASVGSSCMPPAAGGASAAASCRLPTPWQRGGSLRQARPWPHLRRPRGPTAPGAALCCALPPDRTSAAGPHMSGRGITQNGRKALLNVGIPFMSFMVLGSYGLSEWVGAKMRIKEEKKQQVPLARCHPNRCDLSAV